MRSKTTEIWHAGWEEKDGHASRMMDERTNLISVNVEVQDVLEQEVEGDAERAVLALVMQPDLWQGRRRPGSATTVGGEGSTARPRSKGMWSEKAVPPATPKTHF